MTCCQSFEIIEDFEGLIKIKDSWLSLYSRSKVKSIFNSFEWVSIWSENYKAYIERLFIITFKIKSELVAIIPLYIRKNDRDTLWFVGSGEPEEAETCSEGQDILCLTEHIFPKLPSLKKLIKDQGLKKVTFTNVRRYSLLMKWIQKEKYRVICASVGYRFFIPTSPLDKELAKKTMRGRKAAEKINAVVKRIESAEELEKIYPELIKLNSQRWTEKGEQAIFENTTFRQFHLSLAYTLLKSHKLSIVSLEKNNKVIAINYSMVSGDDLIFYQNGVDTKYKPNLSPGMLLHYHQYCFAKSMGLGSYDFMTSANLNGYKKNLASGHEEVFKMDVFFNSRDYHISKMKKSVKSIIRRVIV